MRSLILFAFPTKLPGWKKIQKLRINESVTTDKATKSTTTTAKDKTIPENGRGLKSLFMPVLGDIRILLRNSPFMCLTFNQAAEGFLLAVFSAFMPKFLESQFGAKASDAAFFVGIIVGEPFLSYQLGIMRELGSRIWPHDFHHFASLALFQFRYVHVSLGRLIGLLG